MKFSHQKFLVTAFSGSRQRPIQKSAPIIWDASRPLPLGIPKTWVLQKLTKGFLIQSLQGLAGEIQSDTALQINQEIEKGTSVIELPSTQSGVKNWIRIQSITQVNPAFVTNSKITESKNPTIRVFQCVGNWIHQTSLFKKSYEAILNGIAVFKLVQKKEGFEILSLAQGLKLVGQTRTSVQALDAAHSHTLSREDFLFSTIELNGMSWKFSEIEASALKPGYSPRISEADITGFKKTLTSVLGTLALIFGIILLLPKPEVKEEELIPPQFAKIVLSKPAAPKTKQTDVGGKSQATKAEQTAVVQAFRAKALQHSIKGLLKGGMTKLLSQSNFMSGMKSQSLAQSVFNSDPNSKLIATASLSGKANAPDIKVGSFGGDSEGTSPGYGKGKKAGVAGQGEGFIDLDLGGSSVESGLTKEEVGKVIHSHLSEIRYCYESAMLRNSNTEGKLVVDFTVNPNGVVSSSAAQSSTLQDPRLDDCILRRLATWKFPNPKGGVNVGVTYPFIFKALGK